MNHRTPTVSHWPLEEAKGDRAAAENRYSEFVEPWKSADPELQPTVKDVQSRLTAASC
ncbi:MAG: hypothetical protein ABI085_17395 [Gemmatimonadaceae bacterium]